MRAGNAGSCGTFPRWQMKAKHGVWQLQCCEIDAKSSERAKITK